MLRFLLLLGLAILAVILGALLISRCSPLPEPGAPTATPTPPGFIGDPVQATVQAAVAATLTALAPRPTGTPVPTPPPPTPTSSTALLPTPPALFRTYYQCSEGRWVFERWHFDLGYVRQLGGGRFLLQDGRVLTNCVFEKTEEVKY